MSDPAQVANPKGFACPLCPKTFSNKYYVKQHVVVIHQNSGRYRCTFCNKSAEYRYDIERHERIHTGEKPYGCRICQKRFYDRAQLMTHHVDSHAEKKFKCQTCGMAFGRFSRLRDHQQCHSSERFHCDLCEASYQHRSDLRRHRAGHLGIQPTRSVSLARGMDQEVYRAKIRTAEHPNSNGSSTAPYSLRTRDKLPNYREYEEYESRSPSGKDSDDEPNEPEEAARDDVLEEEELNGNRVRGNERPAKKTNTEKWTPGVRSFDGRIWSSQKRTERERDSDGRTENGTETSTAAYQPPGISPTIRFSADEPPPSSRTDCNANLKVVFDVEYRAPD